VILFLRLVGIFNAAIWFGAVIYFNFFAAPAVFSPDMKAVLGDKNYPFFSGAIAQVLVGRFFHLNLICGCIALLHLAADWLYFGKSRQGIWLSLLLSIFCLNLIGEFWLQPRLKELHAIKYDAHSKPADAQAAAASFRSWHIATRVVDLFILAGLAAYLWKSANPSDPTRFVSTSKFRG
jgi:hypothetical protein